MMNHTEAEVSQWSPDRSVVRMPDGHGVELRGFTPSPFPLLTSSSREFKKRCYDSLGTTAELLMNNEQKRMTQFSTLLRLFAVICWDGVRRQEKFP